MPINDLTFRNNDLVAATAGRAFWILDDLSALQQDYDRRQPISLIQPRETVLFSGGYQEKPTPGLGQNPKSGVILDYYLGREADSAEIVLEILENNRVIRSYTNQPPKDFKTWPGGPSKPETLTAHAGLNRFVWDFRREAIPAVDGVFVMGDYSGSRVAPGNYTARIRMDSTEATQPIPIVPRPDIGATPADFREQQEALSQIEEALRDMHRAVNQLRSVRSQLETYADLLSGDEKAEPLLKLGDSLLQRITDWEEELIQPRQKTFQDVINYNNQLNAEFMYLKGYIDGAEPVLTQGARERLRDLMTAWRSLARERDAIVNEGMEGYNRSYRELGLPALIMED